MNLILIAAFLLEQRSLNNNQLTGDIPASLGQMTRLSCMYARSHLSVGHGTHTHPLVLASRDLMKNHLTGSIPPEVLKMTWYGASIDIYSVLFMKDYTAM